MTGPEHYQAAEELLKQSSETPIDDEDQPRLVWTANVHATLAHAAATALFLPLDPASERLPLDEAAWKAAAGTGGRVKRTSAPGGGGR